MSKPRFIDAGANLTDPNYSGIYHSSCFRPPDKIHKADLKQVLDRSWEAGIEKIIITGKSLSDSRKALEIAKSDERLYVTVGCRPLACKEFEDNMKPDLYLEELKNLIVSGGKKVVAIGECGLDYEGHVLSPKTIQLKYFQLQLTLLNTFNLPLFLYCSKATKQFCNILVKYPGIRGMVRSFRGSTEDADRFIELGFYIGLNGWSLITTENLEMIKKLPIDRIILETDCPFSRIHRCFAGYWHISKENLDVLCVKKEKWRPDFMVNTRNEPCNIRQVLDVVANIRNEEINTLSEQIYQNTIKLFFTEERNF